jgi:copper chaperone CopZ
MKTIKILLVAVFAIAFSSLAFAQTKECKNAVASIQTAQIKVSGNCEYCKDRIEKAAKTAGASKADWSTKAQTLTVTFDTSKTNVDKISQQVAAAGHDTGSYKADNKTYNALPSCCKYDRKK